MHACMHVRIRMFLWAGDYTSNDWQDMYHFCVNINQGKEFITTLVRKWEHTELASTIYIAMARVPLVLHAICMYVGYLGSYKNC